MDPDDATASDPAAESEMYVTALEVVPLWRSVPTIGHSVEDTRTVPTITPPIEDAE